MVLRGSWARGPPILVLIHYKPHWVLGNWPGPTLSNSQIPPSHPGGLRINSQIRPRFARIHHIFGWILPLSYGISYLHKTCQRQKCTHLIKHWRTEKVKKFGKKNQGGGSLARDPLKTTGQRFSIISPNTALFCPGRRFVGYLFFISFCFAPLPCIFNVQITKCLSHEQPRKLLATYYPLHLLFIKSHPPGGWGFWWRIADIAHQGQDLVTLKICRSNQKVW